MAEKKGAAAKGVSDSNTKKELLEAYHELARQLEEKRKIQQKPEEKIEEKRVEKVVASADAISTEGIAREIGNLKSEIGKSLAEISDKLESAVERYGDVTEAIRVREKELEEIYELQRAASSLDALAEVEDRKRAEFDAEMTEQRESLSAEIQTTRSQWEKERTQREEETKEREASEKKRREREKEEYEYAFKRDKELARQKLEDELAALQREVATKKPALEQELRERERALAERENEFQELKKKAESSPGELEAAVAKAVKDATLRLQQEAANKELLLQKEYAGERNVMTAKIDALEKTVKEQAARIEKLTGQIEKSYGQVQEIAVKAIEGSSNSKSLAGLQQLLTEQTRKPAGEK